MIAARPALSRRLRMMGAAISIGAASMLSSAPAFARGPDGIADIAEKVIDAVVNISTSQTIEANKGGAMPQLPPGSPFEEFFDDFFKNRRGPPGKGGDKSGEFQPRKTNSLGSGFIVDTAGIVVTNNHVIADADEINVILNDGTKIKAELVGVDKKTDLAVLKFKPPKPLTAVKFGDSDKIRLGDWVVAIGNPFSLGGTVTAGIVSAVHRSTGGGPFDTFIQTDAAINPGNSGGPLLDSAGRLVGVNSAIRSASGSSAYRRARFFWWNSRSCAAEATYRARILAPAWYFFSAWAVSLRYSLFTCAHTLGQCVLPSTSSEPSQQSHTPSFTNELRMYLGMWPAFAQ